jgi:hypothetical protein
VELRDAVDFARTNRWSVLTTIRANGHPQLSNVAYYVTRPDFFAYAVLEGAVELSPVATRPAEQD